jgi:C4-dicarboxylate-specific signal transduction histidine kinase
MTDQPPSSSIRPWVLLPGATAALAACVFVADTQTPPDCVVSGLYVVVVLMAGRFCRPGRLWLVAAGCVVLTVLAQVLAHGLALGDSQAMIGVFNTLVSILAIGLSTYLIARGQSAEAALRRAQSDLAHVSQVTTLGELTASIAHEVNQPIAGVVTNAGACLRWLAGETPNLDKAREAAARIVRDGTRASDIISRIRLMFAKGEPERKWVDLNLLARETVDLLQSEASRRRASVRMDLAADVPAIMADRVQLQQVLVNLMINGLDAMAAEPGVRELIVQSWRSEDGAAAMSVSDTGVGLPAQPSERLFEAFVTTKPQGTGLGLSISRSIIEAHRGRLWATANTPRGAVFLFALPTPSDGTID